MFNEIIAKAVNSLDSGLVHIPSLKKFMAEKVIAILEAGKGKGDAYLDQKIHEIEVLADFPRVGDNTTDGNGPGPFSG